MSCTTEAGVSRAALQQSHEHLIGATLSDLCRGHDPSVSAVTATLGATVPALTFARTLANAQNPCSDPCHRFGCASVTLTAKAWADHLRCAPPPVAAATEGCHGAVTTELPPQRRAVTVPQTRLRWLLPLRLRRFTSRRTRSSVPGSFRVVRMACQRQLSARSGAAVAATSPSVTRWAPECNACAAALSMGITREPVCPAELEHTR